MFREMRKSGRVAKREAEKAAEEHRNGRLEGGGRGKAAGSGKDEECTEQPKDAQNDPRMHRTTQICAE